MPTETLKSLVYVSRAFVAFDDAALDELARHAADANALQRVSGFLYYEQGRFLQYLEGPAEPVDALMTRIEADRRHDVLRRVDSESLEQRRFFGWHMRSLRPHEFYGVTIETLVVDHLLLTHDAFNADETWRRMTWQMVDRMAKLREQALL